MKTNNIAKQIKAVRTNNGWTQTEFAEKLYTFQPVVSKWERGELEPNILTLVKIAKVANMTVEELAGEEAPKDNKLSEEAKENLKIIQSYAHIAKTGQFDFDGLHFANSVYERVTEILEEL